VESDAVNRELIERARGGDQADGASNGEPQAEAVSRA
jgi:hypothetical protein